MQPVDRSYLFVPGDRPDRFLKALHSGAHRVILDLEDGVAIANKRSARESVGRWLEFPRHVALRLNGADTEWFQDDLLLCGKPGLSAVILAKAETPQDVMEVVARVGPGAVALPQIESALGMANALDIARCAGVQRLVFGALDFQVDMGISGDDLELLFFRSQLVLFSRQAGLQAPVDTPTTAIDSPNLLQEETQRARRLGFGGKLCIHPNQVNIVNSCFHPTPEEVTWAKKVIHAYETAGGRPVILEGKMVDRPVVLKAQRVMAELDHDL